MPPSDDTQQRLSRIEAHLVSELGGDGREGNVQRLLKEIRSDIQSADRAMRGDGQTLGLITRLDRLEQAEVARTWQMRAMWAALLAGVVKAVLDYVHR